MRLTPLFAASLGLVALTACATTPEAADSPPDYSPVAGQPVTSNGSLVLACVTAAAQAGTVDRVADDDAELMRFRCSGAPARALFDGLAAHSAAAGSEFSHDGRTWRSTTRVQRNLFGTDVCSRGADGDVCDINLNVGEFQRP